MKQKKQNLNKKTVAILRIIMYNNCVLNFKVDNLKEVYI